MDTALDALARTLGRARELVDAQPERWEVTTGELIAPVRQEIRAVVSKPEIHMLLDQLEAAVRRVRDTPMRLIFLGD